MLVAGVVHMLVSGLIHDAWAGCYAFSFVVNRGWWWLDDVPANNLVSLFSSKLCLVNCCGHGRVVL